MSGILQRKDYTAIIGYHTLKRGNFGGAVWVKILGWKPTGRMRTSLDR